METSKQFLRWRTPIALLEILLVAFYFRTCVGLYWDESNLLNPDERFLTMVSTDIKLPSGIGEYFDTAHSPLNPHNNKNFPLFVYGTLPIFIAKVAAIVTGFDAYGQVNIVGRVLSGLFDLGAIIFTFLIAAKLFKREVGILAAALLAITVQNIQLSHFYGVENAAAFFVLASFYCCLRLPQDRYFSYWALASGVAFGCALASKVSALFFMPILCLLIFMPLLRIAWARWQADKLTLVNLVRSADIPFVLFLVVMFAALIAFRVFQPYAFRAGSFFDLALADKFRANMKEISSLMNGADYPPSVQWVNRAPILFSLYNMIWFGMGPLLGLSAWFGITLLIYQIIWQKQIRYLALTLWPILWFGYQSTQFVKAGRYLSIVYPFFVIAAAYFLIWIGRFLYERIESYKPLERYQLSIAAAPGVLVLVSSLLWTIAFTNIYREPTTRVAASRWIYENIPCGKTLANEHWDDPLPMRIDGKDGFGGCYNGLELNNYWPDDRHKLEDMLPKLEQADYIVLSSNRLYLSIPRLPKRFPFTIEYYRMLFAHELGFDLIYTGTSYPRIFGLEFSTDSAEEPFTVYDHPKVYIFKKNQSFSIDAIRQHLSSYPDGVVEPLTR